MIKAKWILNLAGFGLSIFSIYFLFTRFDELSIRIGTLDWTPRLIVSVGLAIVIWLGFHCLHVVSWQQNLTLLGITCDLKTVARVTLRSQIAKYLPGNVFHLAGRIGLLKLAGQSAKRASLSVMLEAGLLVFTATLLGLPIIAGVRFPLVLSLAAIALMVLASNRIAAKLRTKTENGVLDAIFGIFSQPIVLLRVIALYLTMLIVSSLAVYLVIEALAGPAATPSFLVVMGSFCLAWTAGFIVVGSPGGIGIREVVFVYLIPDQSLAGILTISILIFRVVTMAGDVLAFAISYLPVFRGQRNA